MTTATAEKRKTEDGRKNGEDSPPPAPALALPPSIVRIPLSGIAISNAVPNPRQNLEGPGFQELLKSIQLQGVLTPVLVRPMTRGAHNGFELIAGGRRFHASQQLKLADIPCIVRSMSDLEATTAQLAENDDREPLTAFEEGAAYAQAIEKFKLNRDAVADIFGKSRAHIYSRLRLHGLDAKVKKELQAREIPDSIADLIATIPDVKRQLEAVEEMLDYDYNADAREKVPLSFRAAKEIIEEEFRVSLKNAPFALDAHGLVDPVAVTKDSKLAHVHQACTTCPKRSGNLNPDSDSPNICTEPACYAVKARAGVVTAAKNYTDIGIPLLPEAESKKLWQSGRDSGDHLSYGAKFVKTTDSCALDKQQRQYKDVVDKHGVKPVAAATPSGKVVLLYRQADVQKALIAAKIMKPERSYEEPRESAEAKAKREAKEEAQRVGVTEVVGECVKRMEGKLAIATERELWLLMCLWRESSGDLDSGLDEIEERRVWENWKKGAEKLDAAGLRALLVESFLFECYSEHYTPGCVEHLAKLLKVDSKAIFKRAEKALSATAALPATEPSKAVKKQKGGKRGK